jgi:hypothetical protein
VCAQGLCRFSLYTRRKFRMHALDAALGLLCPVALFCGFVGGTRAGSGQVPPLRPPGEHIQIPE